MDSDERGLETFGRGGGWVGRPCHYGFVPTASGTDPSLIATGLCVWGWWQEEASVPWMGTDPSLFATGLRLRGWWQAEASVPWMERYAT